MHNIFSYVPNDTRLMEFESFSMTPKSLKSEIGMTSTQTFENNTLKGQKWSKSSKVGTTNEGRDRVGWCRVMPVPIRV